MQNHKLVKLATTLIWIFWSESWEISHNGLNFYKLSETSVSFYRHSNFVVWCHSSFPPSTLLLRKKKKTGRCTRHSSAYVYMRVRVYLHMRVHTYTYAYIHLHIRVYISTYTRTHIYIRVYLSTYTRTHICIRVYISTNARIFYMHAYIYFDGVLHAALIRVSAPVLGLVPTQSLKSQCPSICTI